MHRQLFTGLYRQSKSIKYTFNSENCASVVHQTQIDLAMSIALPEEVAP